MDCISSYQDEMFDKSNEDKRASANYIIPELFYNER